MLKAAAGTGVVTSTTVDVGDSFIERLRLYETAQGAMIGAGFNNKSNDRYNADGFVLIQFGAKRREVGKENIRDTAGDYESIRQCGNIRENTRKDGNGEAEVEHMRLQEVYVRGDGAIVLVGEEQFTNGSANAPRFNYYDLLLPRSTPVEIWPG